MLLQKLYFSLLIKLFKPIIGIFLYHVIFFLQLSHNKLSHNQNNYEPVKNVAYPKARANLPKQDASTKNPFW